MSLTMKTYYLIGASLFFYFIANAQIECVNGMAGSYPCNDYDLMAQIPATVLSESASNTGNDVWGWTDPLDGNEYVIMGLGNGIAFVNITDPVNPIFLGRLLTATGNNPTRDVKVYDHYALTVSEASNHGMQIFDLTRLRGVTSPQIFNEDARYTGAGRCHNLVVNQSNAMVYLLGCSSTNGGGPIFIDLSDPLNPSMVGQYTEKGYSHDAQSVIYNGPDMDYTNREIFIGCNINEMVIIDVTDKTNPVLISDISYPLNSIVHQGWFTEDQRYFLLGDEGDESENGFNTKTIVFDLLDLDSPTVLNNYFGTTKAVDHNGYVKGSQYFLANYTAGMRVIDITDIASGNLEEAGYFDTFPSSDGVNFNGAWSVYPYFNSGNIVISNTGQGLFIVRKSNTLSTNEYDLDQNFSLFPNPTSTNFTILGNANNKIDSIKIYNVLGQNIFSKTNINENIFILPMSDHSKGIYLVKINNKLIKRLIVN